MFSRIGCSKLIKLSRQAFAITPCFALFTSLNLCLQDNLNDMALDRYTRIQNLYKHSVRRGELKNVRWSDDGRTVHYLRFGRPYVLDLTSLQVVLDAQASTKPKPDAKKLERGRQNNKVLSPDGKKRAVHVDANVAIENEDGTHRFFVTTEGNEAQRIKYGIASWVYGEELRVREALWWSPDSKWLAFYRFDESNVPDYDLRTLHPEVKVKQPIEAYPYPGSPNPVAQLYIYNTETRETKTVDTTFDSVEGEQLSEYLYEVRWAPDGKELLFNRSNRAQNIMELVAADPKTGKSRVVIRESWPQSWVDNSPTCKFLENEGDGLRFLWISERNGYRNLYFYDLKGKLISVVTRHDFDVVTIVKVDEKNEVVYYTARSAANPYLVQMHRVGLDGRGEKCLTNPAYSHQVEAAPDGRYFIDVQERLDEPPITQLIDTEGKVLRQLAKSGTKRYRDLGLRPVERFTYTAADGKTKLYGLLHKPADFDPNKQYPLIVTVYGGPESGAMPETFMMPHPMTEAGFLVATFNGRGTMWRGKAFRDAVYGKLGIVEVDDQAEGVKYLLGRPYVDGSRVGIFGTSYGGYASIMALLRYPELFHAACASSSVTDWRLYDSIYTERYQGLLNENQSGYQDGATFKYAKNLKGGLLLFYGTVDNNVHPDNTIKLVEELKANEKPFELVVGKGKGHVSLEHDRILSFFEDHFIHPYEDQNLSNLRGAASP